MTASAHADIVRALLSARTTQLADVEPDASAPRLLLLSDVLGTMQLAELRDDDLSGDAPPPHTLTDLPEPVRGAHYVPGSRTAVLEIDAGGDERTQLFALDLDRDAPAASLAELRALTEDPRHGHHCAGVSPDGRLLAYTSNRADGVDFDLYLCDLRDGGHRLLWRSGGWALPASGFSHDGHRVSALVAGDQPLHDRLVIVGLDGETSVWDTPGRASLFGPPAWLDDHRFLVSTDVDGDRRALVEQDVRAPRRPGRALAGSGAHDTDVVVGRDGTVAVAIENRDGASVLRAVDLHAGALGATLPIPHDGVVAPMLGDDGATLYYTLTGPRIPGDVFALHLASGATRRLTHSPCAVAAEALAEPRLGTVASFDGERIPYFVYRPTTPSDPAGPLPVVVFVHGGPESQSRRIFNPIAQALVAAGYGVIVPNVRGSTGYGRRYASLDDTTRRLDSVADLAAIHGALAGEALDPARAALWGASYGGYMVLSGVAHQPDRWAAGVDIVGISDLVTFLENTSVYRRAHREREYGSLSADRGFLRRASPLTHIEAMRAPLFIIHGRNDPRVPVGEAEQLLAGLRGRGVPCELVIYDDEGHGLARLANRLDAYPRAIAFLDDALHPTETRPSI